MGFYRLDDIVHLLSSFAHSKAAYGITGQVQLGNPFHMVHPDIRIGAALVDAPKHLLLVNSIGQGVQPGIFRLTPFQPTEGTVSALLHIVPGRRIFHTLVKGHTNIRTQIGLDAHTLLRAHKNLMPIDMRGKGNALLLDFPQGCQAKHLESAGVCKDWAVPGHKFMQASAFLYQLITGTQVQVVGITQLHLAADVL